MLETEAMKELMENMDLLDEKKCDFIRKEYRSKKGEEMDISNSFHKMLVGEAMRMVSAMKDYGATKEELTEALYYLRVCMDSMKYRMDYIRYREENGIEQLAAKYGIKLRKWKKVA